MSKLVLIGPLPKENATGVAVGFEALVSGLRKNGYDPIVVDLQMSGEPVSSGNFSLRRSAQLLRPLITSLRKIPFGKTVYLTIACSRAGFFKDMIMIWWAALFGKRIILHLKSGGYADFYQQRSPVLKWLIKRTLNRAEKIIALGQSIREQFSFVSNFHERVIVVHNGPPNEIKGSSPHRDLLKETDTLKVLFLSNLIPSKGFMDVLDAAKILKERGNNQIEFHFCGAFQKSEEEWPADIPSDAEQFRDRIRQYQLEDSVTYHGTVRGQRKEDFLATSDIFILPTNYPTEGQPISIIEAMAHSIPVIATAWRGIVDQVTDQETGYFVPFASPENIADRIQYLRDNPELLLQFGKNSLQRYLREFTQEKHIERMTKILFNQP